MNKAREALAHQGSQPLPSPLVASGHPSPPPHMGYEMERGLNSRAQQVIPGHGGATAVSRNNQINVLTAIYTMFSNISELL